MQKYKVFLNEKSILFRTAGKITITKPISSAIDFTQISDVKQWLDEFEISQERDIIFESDNADKDFLNFRKALLNLDAAGGVVKRKGCLLFIFRNGKWDLPKGKIDDGESAEVAAMREVEEECGINSLKITGKLNPTYHIYRSPYRKTRGEWIFKKTYWFEMDYRGIENGTPETEEGITDIRWFKMNQLDEVLQNTYGNIKVLLNNYHY